MPRSQVRRDAGAEGQPDAACGEPWGDAGGRGGLGAVVDVGTCHQLPGAGCGCSPGSPTSSSAWDASTMCLFSSAYGGYKVHIHLQRTPRPTTHGQMMDMPKGTPLMSPPPPPRPCPATERYGQGRRRGLPHPRHRPRGVPRRRYKSARDERHDLGADHRGCVGELLSQPIRGQRRGHRVALQRTRQRRPRRRGVASSGNHGVARAWACWGLWGDGAWARRQ